jgi:hypothetical protein
LFNIDNYAALSGRNLEYAHFPTQGVAIGLSYYWISANIVKIKLLYKLPRLASLDTPSKFEGDYFPSNSRNYQQ